MEIFIWLPTDDIDKMDNLQIDDFVAELNILIKRIRFEKNTTLHYKNDNIAELIDLIETHIEIESYGTIDLETLILSVLYDANAHYISEIENNCIYKLWNIDSQTISNNFPTILKNYVDKSIANPTVKYLFLNFRNASNFRGTIPVFKDNRDDETLPKFVHINQTNKFMDTDEWILKNRIERNYNRDDNRHVENHPDYRRGKSPIIGGEGGKANLKNLLPSALCDNQMKDLIAYDEAAQRYVWYEYEYDNPQNQYHGYHLVKPTTHLQDLDAEKNIPIEVIEIIEYRRKIREQE